MFQWAGMDYERRLGEVAKGITGWSMNVGLVDFVYNIHAYMIARIGLTTKRWDGSLSSGH